MKPYHSIQAWFLCIFGCSKNRYIHCKTLFTCWVSLFCNGFTLGPRAQATPVVMIGNAPWGSQKMNSLLTILLLEFLRKTQHLNFKLIYYSSDHGDTVVSPLWSNKIGKLPRGSKKLNLQLTITPCKHSSNSSSPKWNLKMWDKKECSLGPNNRNVQILFLETWQIFPEKTRILQQTIPFCFLIFTFQQNFTPKENTVMWYSFCCELVVMSILILTH